ncbi:MAG: hypothetical protein Q8Q85_04710 [Gemmatimonadales bacterium]|nr:hypothetical protein [Gemmatimonadales bacterium]
MTTKLMVAEIGNWVRCSNCTEPILDPHESAGGLCPKCELDAELFNREWRLDRLDGS